MAQKSNAGKIWDMSRYNYEFRYDALLKFYNTEKTEFQLDKLARRDWFKLPPTFKKWMIKNYG